MQDDSSLVLVHEGFSGEGREASIFGRYLEEEKESNPVYNCIKKNKIPGNKVNQGGERPAH